MPAAVAVLCYRDKMPSHPTGHHLVAVFLAAFAFCVSVVHAAPPTEGVDLTRLPLGDGRLSSGPKRGYIWPCRIEPSVGGAFRDGPWIRSDGTFDFTGKAVVDGSITWPSHFAMSLEGDRRVFSTNDFPDHPTGRYPISSSDDAYQYDRNPNSIREQSMRVELPANPQLAPTPSCAPGAVGILLTGTVLFSALDAPGRDAVAHETQDRCQGHPQVSGVYHYHSVTTCLPDETMPDGHSTLVGYALDGFGIFDRRGVGGKVLTSGDLDECHGHTHQIRWDDKPTLMYHYHATWDFPYSVGCLRGSYKPQDVRTISGPAPARMGQGMNQDRPTDGPSGGTSPAQAPPGRHSSASQGDRPPRPDLTAAAARLGISEEQLRHALGPPPPDLEATARRLGISVEQLRDALHPQ